MTRRKYAPEYEQEDGWTRWIPPKPGTYRFMCCDCGLVHDMQFKIGEIVDRKDGGWLYLEDVEDEDLVVQFRVRRNNRSTAQVRRRDHTSPQEER